MEEVMKLFSLKLIMNLVFVFWLALIGKNLYAQNQGYELVWHDEFDGIELDT